MVKKYADLYLDCRRQLLENEEPHMADFMARQLLEHYSGRSRASLLSDRDLYASEDLCAQMETATRRLLTGEPLAYVLGQWEFYGLTLTVNENVLIPRDDTCAVASLAINQALFLGKDPRILDLCTGSGCIGIAIASRVQDARVTLADLSREALAVARKNVTAHKLSGRVSCIQADALKPAPAVLGKFDLIVSNPPYITGDDMTTLDRSVKNFEPSMALFGGDDGLDFYRSIAKNYASALKPGGYLCFEFGDGQGDDVCRILVDNGYKILERTKDFNDRERAVLAQYGGKED